VHVETRAADRALDPLLESPLVNARARSRRQDGVAVGAIASFPRSRYKSGKENTMGKGNNAQRKEVKKKKAKKDKPKPATR